MKRKRYIHSRDYEVDPDRSYELLYLTRQYRRKLEDIDDIERAARAAAGDQWEALIVGINTQRDVLEALTEAGYKGSKQDFMKQRRKFLAALNLIRERREGKRMEQRKQQLMTEEGEFHEAE